MAKWTDYVMTAETTDILCVAQNTLRFAQSKAPMYGSPANGYQLFRRSDLQGIFEPCEATRQLNVVNEGE